MDCRRSQLLCSALVLTLFMFGACYGSREAAGDVLDDTRESRDFSLADAGVMEPDGTPRSIGSVETQVSASASGPAPMPQLPAEPGPSSPVQPEATDDAGNDDPTGCYEACAHASCPTQAAQCAADPNCWELVRCVVAECNGDGPDRVTCALQFCPRFVSGAVATLGLTECARACEAPCGIDIP